MCGAAGNHRNALQSLRLIEAGLYPGELFVIVEPYVFAAECIYLGERLRSRIRMLVELSDCPRQGGRGGFESAEDQRV